ncbi:MAG TPA: ThuA domain-containing protein [Flavisolibacter sp.]|nr:ThuA domain-containing protein [Flavisolibacter sp.]
MKKVIPPKSFVLVFLCYLSLQVMAQTKKPIRVLIVDGYSNHDWKQTSNLTKAILEESGLFTVDVSMAPATTNQDSLAQWNPDFTKYDAIIQNSNNIHNSNLKWPRRVEESLEKYVAGGGGLYLLHSANNAFPHWKEYDKMMGLGWRPKEYGFALAIDSNKNIIRIPPGEGARTSHGKRFDAMIHILNRHPINNGFPAQWVTPSMELYTHPRGPAENITVLSYAFDTATKKHWPVEWVVQYGRGSVYNSSMGHLWKDEIYPISYRCIGFQTTMLRAVEWLATGKVTYLLPNAFPKGSISIRDEADYPRSGKTKAIDLPVVLMTIKTH